MADNSRLIRNQLLEDRMETATKAFSEARQYIRSVSRTSDPKVKEHMAENAKDQLDKLVSLLDEALDMALNIK